MNSPIPPNATILFQGDSITDTGRNRENAAASDMGALGAGYAAMAAAMLLAQRPAYNLRFFNRGISGNRVVDLYARIKCDAINLKPDLLSILIGVNDTWHGFNYSNGVELPKYERFYRNYLAEVRDALPAIRFVLCEPFVLPCGVVAEDWITEMKGRSAIVEALAAEFDAIHVPFQKIFDAALSDASPSYWAADGVHPTAAGHMLMANAWVAAVTRN